MVEVATMSASDMDPTTSTRSSAANVLIVEAGSRRWHIRQVLTSPWCENFMTLVILANFVLIIVETDARAEDEDAPPWMDWASYSVLVLFVAELTLRLYTEREFFFRDAWNLFDFAIVASDAIASLVAVILSNIFPVSLLRVLRLAKVARVSKIFRMFPELRLMLAGLLGSIRAILWGTVLLLIALLLVSVIAVQFIHPLNKELERSGFYYNCERCGKSYQSVLDSCLTFSQQILAGDSWGEVTIPIIEHYPLTAIYFVAVFLLIGLAVHNLILGVIVDVAQESRKGLMKELERKRTMARKESQTSLLKIFIDMDSDGSGSLTKDELVIGYEENQGFRDALKCLDISKEDLDIIWIIMDEDKSGHVLYNEFVAELYNLKNSDTQFMIAYIKYYITIIKDTILAEMKVVEADISNVTNLQKEIQAEVEEDLGLVHKARKSSKEHCGRNEKKMQEQQTTDASGVVGLAQKDKDDTDSRLASSEGALRELMVDMKQHQSVLMTRLEAIEAKVEVSLVDSTQQSQSSLPWALPWHCQRVGTLERDNKQCDKTLVVIPNSRSESRASDRMPAESPSTGFQVDTPLVSRGPSRTNGRAGA